MTYSINTLPLTVHLNCHHAVSLVECTGLLRHLPGKRLVYKGSWGERPVVIKMFLDANSARRHQAREKAGVEALQRARVSTPELLYSGDTVDGMPVLIFAFLPEAKTAMESWRGLTTIESQGHFLQKLVEPVSLLHEAGLVQKDLHFENFLVSGDKIFAVDGDAICSRGSGRPLNLKSSGRNLALFFAQLPARFDALVEPTAHHYAMLRQMSGTLLLSRLESALPKVRRRRRLNYVNKCYRNCSEFTRLKMPGKVTTFRRDAQGETLSRLLEDPEAFMQKGKLLKGGNTSTVVRVRTDTCDWVIKRYNIKNPWHALIRCFRPTRAWTSWGNAHRLQISGIASPHAIAMIEKRFGPLRSTGYYVCAYQAGSNAETYFRSEAVDDATKMHVAGEFVRLFALFKQLGIHHGDCKASNFLISDNLPCVLDLDAMRECGCRERFERLFLVDRQRFLRNWQSQPGWQKWFDDHLPR